MACPINMEEVNKLKMFVSFCSAQPSILNMPQLEFFKKFVEQLGGKVPEAEETPKPKEEETKRTPFSQPKPTPMEEDESDPESEVELDLPEEKVEPDNDDAQEMGETDKVPSEEDMDEASDLRPKAATAYAEKNFEEAINIYTQAILLNPTNALFYAKRGQAFVKILKPNACIRDCNRALELNPDSAVAFKFRGRAHTLLQNWEDAAKDLRQACKIDYDEEADEWLREVTPNAKKLEQHRIKMERKKAEKELKARQERVRQAQEANKKAAEEQQSKPTFTPAGSFPGNGGGGGGGMPDFMGGMTPDLLNAFKDPEVAEALKDIMANPANIVKYQNNPKIMKLMNLVGGAAGGAGFGGGAPGGFGGAPGGFGGFPGFGGGPPTGPPSSAQKPDLHDDGLD